ncbi:alpha/beta hydrolase [Saccharothrix longispora]|uniref:alpha/beta hydrolase n=1 Tax=Saccharothrix longispora TaxID=33920 RepID=UPI0028FD0C2A|nr:alpha/beta hydrolase [Saccharothrix longispora]MDU0288590.1 alpha/beta hydrolase [Saccharothrix longispora]
MRGRVLPWSVAAVTIVAVVLGGAFAFQRKLVFLPSGAAGGPPSGAHEVVLTTGDGLRLTAWHFPVADARAAVLVAPGNAGNRSLRAPLARALAARGLSVLLLEYRGFGGNPGSPSEEGLALDVRAARDFLVGSTDAPLVYFGESLGSAVVAELAVEHPPAGVVLRSPFTDLAAVGRRHYPFLPVRWLLLDEFRTVDHVARTAAPVTVVLGDADSVVPPEQSRAVADAAGGRAVVVPGADHNDRVLLDGPEVVGAVLRFTS